MRKEELLELTKGLFELKSRKEAEEFLEKVDKLVEAVYEKLESDKKVAVGKHVVVEKKHVDAKHTDARVGRNPRTGEPVNIGAKDVPAHDELRIKAK